MTASDRRPLPRPSFTGCLLTVCYPLVKNRPPGRFGDGTSFQGFPSKDVWGLFYLLYRIAQGIENQSEHLFSFSDVSSFLPAWVPYRSVTG